MAAEDDEDNYLYGDEAGEQDQEPRAKRLKADSGKKVKAKETTDAKGPKGKEPEESKEIKNDKEDESVDESGVSDSESEESEIEFVINSGQRASAPVKSAPYGAKSAASEEANAEGAASASGTSTKEGSGAGGGHEKTVKLDIDAVAEYNGKPILEADLEEDFKDKPWRKPGADLTDYFNYGFDEFTWIAYCSKQDTVREKYTPQKVMASMGMPAMPMPGMPGMPGMQGMGMPGMQGMPGMPGMPMFDPNMMMMFGGGGNGNNGSGNGNSNGGTDGSNR